MLIRKKKRTLINMLVEETKTLIKYTFMFVSEYKGLREKGIEKK